MPANKPVPGQTPYFGDFVSPDGLVVSARDADEQKMYQDFGYRQASVADFKHEEIRKVYDNWYGAAASFGNGVLDALPFAQTAITGAIDHIQGDQAARDYAENVKNTEEFNPTSHLLGQVVGSVPALAAGEGTLGAAAEAYKGAETTGLGAGLLGDGAAMMGMPGGPVQGLSTLEQIGQGAAVNVALGTANKIDRAALAHLTEPGGEEKIYASIAPDLLFDAIVGGVAGGSAALLPKLAKKMGDWTEMLANQQWRQAMVDGKTYATFVQQGRATEFGRMLDQYAIYGKQPDAVRNIVKRQLRELEGQYEGLKVATDSYRMSPQQGGILADEVGNILGEAYPEVAKRAMADIIATGTAPNVRELHTLRSSIDKAIDFSSGMSNEAYALQQPLFDAREAITKHIGDFLGGLDAANNGVMANSWQTLDRDFSNLSLLHDGLKTGEINPSLKDIRLGRKPWYVGLIAHSLGMPLLGKVFTSFQGASVMREAFEKGVFAKTAKGLADTFHGVSDKMSKAVYGGLLGAAAETSALMHADAFDDSDYDAETAKVRHAAARPQITAGNIYAAATKANLPDSLINNMTVKTVNINRYLADHIYPTPNPTFGSGIPSTFRPPPEMRRKWIGMRNSAADPSYALLNPTTDNMDTMKIFYPELYKTTSEAIVNAVSSATNVPLEAQTWASRVLGRPIGALMDSEFYTMLTMARQTKPQGPQNRGAGQNTKTGPVIDPDEQTALEKLQMA